MATLGDEEGEVDQYVSGYFSVDKFREAYAQNVPALFGRDQWTIVDPGFNIHGPFLTRPPGRLRKNRTITSAEGGAPRR
jgi:hypothetical protein